MIFVTVGTQFFDELIDEVDRLAGEGVFDARVLAQIGLAKRMPLNIETVPFVKDMLAVAGKADLIITHAGTGSLMEFIALGRPFIAVVNDTKAGNHQLEFLERLGDLYDFCWIPTPKALRDALPHARPATPLVEPGIERLATDIKSFIDSVVPQAALA